MLVITSAAGSIATLGGRSLLATTTLIEGLAAEFWALRATRTKAVMTTRASTIPRMVNGLVNLRPLVRERTADTS
jgi:hypothetical protein